MDAVAEVDRHRFPLTQVRELTSTTLGGVAERRAFPNRWDGSPSPWGRGSSWGRASHSAEYWRL